MLRRPGGEGIGAAGPGGGLKDGGLDPCQACRSAPRLAGADAGVGNPCESR